MPSSTVTSPRSHRLRLGHWALVAIAVVCLVLASDLRIPAVTGTPDGIDGPFASLLASSTDLGQAHGDHVQLTATLIDDSRPEELMGWADAQDLSVRWNPGDAWAIVEGRPAAVATALGVEVHDYRGRKGQEFYASPQQPAVPATLLGEVTALGRILSYTPHHTSKPMILPLDVPDRGLTPDALLTTYNAAKLARDGFTGKGTTIVIFAFNGFAQSDLDSFTTKYGLPKLNPTIVGNPLPEPYGETTMDLEVAHAIAPDAKMVVVNARPTFEGGGGAYEKIGKMLADTDRQFPGAIWSFSIGWGCDKLMTEADLAPVRSALADAQTRGTVAFDASGDLAGLECKGGDDWDSPPGPSDIGLDSVASLPEMTNVGGTTLSTDATGKWLAEQAWFDVPLSQGTGGGTSTLFDVPVWQRIVANNVPDSRNNGRMTPDISAVADPFTGVKIVLDGMDLVGGGTSQSAPIWAGLAAVMTQYLTANGGGPIGELNPYLYRIAVGAPLPAFRDVTLGGNAVDSAGPGYDLVSGLGTPDVDNLVRNLLTFQRTSQ
jgi:kumamolisin